MAPPERLRDQRALAGARDSGDHGEYSSGNVDRDVLEVVQRDLPDRQFALRLPACLFDLACAAQTEPGDRLGRAKVFERSSKTTSPPCTPARGPTSTTWSAISMTSGSCSTTSTVLPLSRSARRRSLSRPTSRGCRPTLGSSKM